MPVRQIDSANAGRRLPITMVAAASSEGPETNRYGRPKAQGPRPKVATRPEGSSLALGPRPWALYQSPRRSASRADSAVMTGSTMPRTAIAIAAARSRRAIVIGLRPFLRVRERAAKRCGLTISVGSGADGRPRGRSRTARAPRARASAAPPPVAAADLRLPPPSSSAATARGGIGSPPPGAADARRPTSRRPPRRTSRSACGRRAPRPTSGSRRSSSRSGGVSTRAAGPGSRATFASTPVSRRSKSIRSRVVSVRRMYRLRVNAA